MEGGRVDGARGDPDVWRYRREIAGIGAGNRCAILPAIPQPVFDFFLTRVALAMAQINSAANGSSPSPVPASEVASVRQRTANASLLPRRTYHDPAVLAYELEAWFANGWVCIGREEDIELPGRCFFDQTLRRESDHCSRQ